VLNAKFVDMGAVLKGFRDELVNLGLWDRITIVVSSEMGRTTTPNTSGGTDHGWGGHHIVMGGNVRMLADMLSLFDLHNLKASAHLCSAEWWQNFGPSP